MDNGSPLSRDTPKPPDAFHRSPLARSRFFSGVPAPAGALLALVPLAITESGAALVLPLVPRYVMVTVANCIVAWLMVCSLPTLSSKMLLAGDPKTASHLRPKSQMRALLQLLFAALLVWLALAHTWKLLLFLQLVYAISLPFGPFIYTYYAV